MRRSELKAMHKPVQNYYAALRQFDDLGVTHETAVRSAFQGLLDHCARQHDWTLVSKDKPSLTYNDFLTLDGIPPETFEYRLGNRSALEWVIDQYQVSTDKRSGITNDPNRPDDPEYIVRLLGQVITVSLETVKVVEALPALDN